MRIEARRRVVRAAQYGGTEGAGRLGAESANQVTGHSLHSGTFVWLSYCVKTSLVAEEIGLCLGSDRETD